MILPESEREQVKGIAYRYRQHYFVPRGDEFRYLMSIGSSDPTALEPVVQALVAILNTGRLSAGTHRSCFVWLDAFAQLSEYLREAIVSEISQEVLEFYCGGNIESDIQGFAKRLSDTLRLERPKHYFDLCRTILTNGGSIFVIGAGFSYDSYAPLTREMQGVACSVLDDLGEVSPRELYSGSEQEAWRRISNGWQIFQKHVAYVLLPKEPSDQHLILAELFHEGLVTHILSFNWDDLTEKAHKKLYSVDIPVINKDGQSSDHALWKPHGDVAIPNERWVLPYEHGRVFAALEQIAHDTTLQTFIIGYREQEQLVRTKLIEPLEKRGGVTRIRPDAPNEPSDSFADNALSAMRKIKDGIESARKNIYPA